jgi:hypothetical protein
MNPFPCRPVFNPGIVDNGGKFATGVVDRGDAPKMFHEK